jgi:type IV pilus assembly protein PilM
MGVGDFFKKIFSSFGKETSILGVDIGTSSVKIVQLKKEKERAILETYGELAIGPYNKLKIGQAVKISEDLVAGAVKDLLKEANVKARTAVVSVPMAASFITVVNLPLSTQDNISEVIKMEARRYIPVPLSEVALDWWIIPETPGNDSGGSERKNIKVLLAAIHGDTINLYRNIVSKAGLNVKMYEIECFSFIRSCIAKESSPVAILDFGASTTKMAIVDYGIMKATHTIGHGSQELTLALSRSLNIDFGPAEEMKREIGLSDLPEHREVVSVMEPVLDYIFAEANDFIKDFQQRNNRSIGKLIVSGGGSLLKGLIDFSVKKFNIEVELADSFAKVEYPAFLSGAVKEAGANFSIAAGLALREL